MIKFYEYYRNVNILIVIGVFLGILGGVFLIVGFIVVFFIFGVGFVVLFVGVGIGGMGGLVMFGFKVVEIIFMKLGLNEV